MLYKKVHRQFLRQFWKGRKFRIFGDEVYEVTSKPYIEKDYNGNYINIYRWYLISLDSGKMILHNIITWLLY